MKYYSKNLNYEENWTFRFSFIILRGNMVKYKSSISRLL